MSDKKYWIDMGDTKHCIEKLNEMSSPKDTVSYMLVVAMAALANTQKDSSWKSKYGVDGTDPSEKYGSGVSLFYLGIQTPEGPVVVLIEATYWDMFKCKEVDRALYDSAEPNNDFDKLLSLA